MRCCGMNCDYLRARLDAAEAEGTDIDFQVAEDLLFPKDEITDNSIQEQQKAESGDC